MLKNFVEHGVPALGIDPGPPQAAAAIAAGVPTLQEFFDADVARRLRAEGRQADVIIANNVMAHTPTLNSFVEGLSILLADDGVATIENTYVKDLIDHCEFDTIYHEHFSLLLVHRGRQADAPPRTQAASRSTTSRRCRAARCAGRSGAARCRSRRGRSWPPSRPRA